MAMAFDLEIKGDEEVEYDISRERITGNGRRTVMQTIEASVYDGLKDTGTLDRLAHQTRRIVDLAMKRRDDLTGRDLLTSAKVMQDAKLLEDVAALLPTGRWPPGLHKSIAERLGISNNQATRAITTLIESGRIEH